MSVPAIPTTYGGVIFRSRLEARWAVFFGELDVRWHYEFEGYQLRSGWYLPDFWLPDLDTWIEIKPSAPSDAEQAKCRELADATERRVVLLHGAPGWWLNDGRETSKGGGEAYFSTGGWDSVYLPCVCVCGRVGIEFDGRGDRVCGDKCTTGDKGYSSDNDRIVIAVKRALSFRFSYGKDRR